jgi:hypothetical protein
MINLEQEFSAWESKVRSASEKIKDEEIIVVDWAGIGDANCHSRLIIENLYEYDSKKICWITPEIIKNLYKDDTCIIFWK